MISSEHRLTGSEHNIKGSEHKLISSVRRLAERFTGGDERSRTVKCNALLNIIIKCFNILAQLVLVPLTLNFVSKELYGIWLTISSVVLWLGFFDIGLTLGLKNRLAEAIACGDWQRGRRLVTTSYVIVAFIFVPLCLCLVPLISLIDWGAWLNVDSAHNLEIMRAMYVLLGCFCTQMVVRIITYVAAAFQRVALSEVFPVLGNVVSIAVIYLLTRYGSPSLVSLALAISVPPVLIIAVCSVVFYHTCFSRVAPRCGYFDTTEVRDLMQLGVKFFILKVQILVVFQFTNFLIANISSPEYVTYYNISYKYLITATMFSEMLLSPLWPAFTDAYTKGDYRWMRNVYSKLRRLYALILPLVLLMIAASPLVYRLWLGTGINIPMKMTFLVGLYVIISALMGMHVCMINGIGKIHVQTVVNAVGMTLHIPLSYLLGIWAGLGPYGVIVSMTAIHLMYVAFCSHQLRLLLNGTAHGVWNK